MIKSLLELNGETLKFQVYDTVLPDTDLVHVREQ
jgi:hypothetical protein